MKPTLSPEEKARYMKREVIAKDDPNAHATAAGWTTFLATRPAAGTTGPDVPNGLLWIAMLPAFVDDDCNPSIHIECERWTDALVLARAVASNESGKGVEPEVHRLLDPPRVAGHRWQVRWAGSALDPRDPLRLEARATDSGLPWTPVRDLFDVRDEEEDEVAEHGDDVPMPMNGSPNITIVSE